MQVLIKAGSHPFPFSPYSQKKKSMFPILYNFKCLLLFRASLVRILPRFWITFFSSGFLWLLIDAFKCVDAELTSESCFMQTKSIHIFILNLKR